MSLEEILVRERHKKHEKFQTVIISYSDTK